MDEIEKLQTLVKEHNITIKMNSIGCSWLGIMSFSDETLVHHYASKNMKDLFQGMINEIENKYKK